MKSLFFICYGGGHAAMILPILKRLESLNKYKITVLALTTGYKYLRDAGISCIGYKDLTAILPCANWEIEGVRLVGEKCKYKGTISYEESIAYHGINYTDLVIEAGSFFAEEKYSLLGRSCFYPINFMRKIFHHFKPDLVIATNSPRSERAAIDAAGELNILSMCIVDLFAVQERKWITNKNYANKILVINDSVKNMFISDGRKEHEISVTGNPAFDSILSEDTLRSAKKLTNDKYKDDYIYILYASQPEPLLHPFENKKGDPELPRKIEKTLRDFVGKDKNFCLVVRYHPSEKLDFIKNTRVLFSPKEESLHALLHCVDLVIVMTSTVGLEASLAGKKVISVDRSIFTADAPYSTMGVSVGVKHERDLPSKIYSVMNNYEKINTIKAFTKADATTKVVKEIVDMLND